MAAFGISGGGAAGLKKLFMTQPGRSRTASPPLKASSF